MKFVVGLGGVVAGVLEDYWRLSKSLWGNRRGKEGRDGLTANAARVFWGEFCHVPYLTVNDYPKVFCCVVCGDLFG